MSSNVVPMDTSAPAPATASPANAVPAASPAVPITAAPPPPAQSYAEQVRAAKISKALRRGRPGGWTSNWKRF
jgi:hypothetical protein